mgnify:CR=1 FL=1
MTSDSSKKYIRIAAVIAIVILVVAGLTYLATRGGEEERRKEIPTEVWIERLNEGSSIRTGYASSKVLTVNVNMEGGPLVSIAASSAAIGRIGSEMTYNPVLVHDLRDDAYQRYMGLTDRDPEEIDSRDPENSTIQLAMDSFRESDFLMIYSSYAEGLKGIALSTYYNIPMIYAPRINDNVRDLLDELGTKYVISIGESPIPDLPTMGLGLEEGPCHNEVFMMCLESRGDSTDYVVALNPGDIDMGWEGTEGIPVRGTSAAAPQLIAYRKALSFFVEGYNRSELGVDMDDKENYNQMGAAVEVANGYSDGIKEMVLHAWDLSKEKSSLDLKYLGLVGDPIAVPYHYEYFDPGSGGVKFSNTNFVASDYYFADLEGDEKQDIAYGRVMGRSVTDASLLLIRSLGFEEYSQYQFEVEDDLDQRVYDTLSPDWRENAGVFVGTSKPFPMPGALKHMKKHHYEVLGSAGMFVTSEESMKLNDISADMVMDKMNYLMYTGHGLQSSWYSNRVDNIDSVFVSGQKLKPGFSAVMACLTGRTDNLDDGLEDLISLSFIHAGLNGYIGSSRLAYGLFKVGQGEQGLLIDTGALYLVDRISLNFCEGSMTIGELLMRSRNDLIEHWGLEGDEYSEEAKIATWEYVLYGDPAWTPA